MAMIAHCTTVLRCTNCRWIGYGRRPADNGKRDDARCTRLFRFTLLLLSLIFVQTNTLESNIRRLTLSTRLRENYDENYGGAHSPQVGTQ